METTQQIKAPEITDLHLAFGTVEGLPPYSDIPKEFTASKTKWNQLFNDLFFNGLKSLQLHPKEGIDPVKAQRHIKALMKSFEPKHEHKEAGVAYLMSKYFEDAEWERA